MNCENERGVFFLLTLLCPFYSMRIQPKDYVKDILRCASGKGFNYDQVSGVKNSVVPVEKTAYFEKKFGKIRIRFRSLS